MTKQPPTTSRPISWLAPNASSSTANSGAHRGSEVAHYAGYMDAPLLSVIDQAEAPIDAGVN